MTMKKNFFVISLVAGCLLVSSCVSKKDLENCKLENKESQTSIFATL